MSGITLARPLQLEGKPVTRVENYCATGSEALRQAAYAVASGAYDIAMAVGAEKVKDSGYAGLNAFPVPNDGTARTLTAAAMFSMVAPAYAKRYGVDETEIKDVLARIAWKNHYNGARNPRAQFRREMSMEAICASPRVAGPLGILDCAGVADGAAAAIVVRAEDAHALHRQAALHQGAVARRRQRLGPHRPRRTTTRTSPRSSAARPTRTRRPGITDPRHELAMAEVHDCFTPTELVLMEDLGFAERGTAWKEELAGTFDLGGELPVNPDGGLKSFGHPVGASGLADDVRVLAAAAGRGARGAPDRQRPAARPHAQPRRLPGRDGLVRLGRRPRRRVVAPWNASDTSRSTGTTSATGAVDRGR